VTPDGIISTFAGKGTQGYSGDGGQAVNAEFTPSVLAMDAAGNLYVTDGVAGVIRKISPDGVISTFAGNGVKGYTGDGGPATKASITDPGGVALDGAGNVFIADSGNNVIRKVTADGTITTVAENYNLPYEYSGDGGPATGATFQNPVAVAVDSSGNLFHCRRK
jgi:trimeric autotransporter adhesin